VPVDPVLRQSLREWIAIVKRCAYGRGARLRIRPETYKALHERLVEACRSQAGAAEPGTWRFFWKLGEMIRPWVTLESLAMANREILYDLLARCQHAQRECEGRSWQFAPGGRVLPILLVLGVVVVGWLVDRFVYPFWDRLDSWMNEVWFTVNQTLDLQWWVVGGAILALLLMFLVSRSART
jgi:hypothetical protein